MAIQTTTFIISLFCFLSCFQGKACSQDQYFREIKKFTYNHQTDSVIGTQTTYVVKAEDTFLDIARNFELGLSELTTLYPDEDIWMPTEGSTVHIPSFWVLPLIAESQLVVNIPEMRLYYFDYENSVVQTYPVSIGSMDYKTPSGRFFISEKRKNPIWYIPESLQEKYGINTMAPGPENPLGEYVMRFSDTSYSLHGTHMPWGVGRLISHGCLRSYPEHIRLIYTQVDLGTKVSLIYAPIKFGIKNSHIFVEVHPDVYNRISDFTEYADKIYRNYAMRNHIDKALFDQAIRIQNGVPVDVTFIKPVHVTPTDRSGPEKMPSILETYIEEPEKCEKSNKGNVPKSHSSLLSCQEKSPETNALKATSKVRSQAPDAF